MKKSVLCSMSMLYLFIFSFFSLVSIVTSPALAAPVLWEGNGHYYEVINQGVSDPEYTWFDAKIDSENSTYNGMTGYLATITSEEEQTFIESNLLPTVDHWAAWLGGYQPDGDTDPDAAWVWVTGEEWSYTNWGTHEPNGGTTENYLNITTNDASWNDYLDYNEGYSVSYIVEYPVPIPAAVYLLGSGLIALIGFRRKFK